MTLARAFPIATLTLNLFASAAYGCACDWRRCIYWLAAAVITAAVTF